MNILILMAACAVGWLIGWFFKPSYWAGFWGIALGLSVVGVFLLTPLALLLVLLSLACLIWLRVTRQPNLGSPR